MKFINILKSIVPYTIVFIIVFSVSFLFDIWALAWAIVILIMSAVRTIYIPIILFAIIILMLIRLSQKKQLKKLIALIYIPITVFAYWSGATLGYIFYDYLYENEEPKLTNLINLIEEYKQENGSYPEDISMLTAENIPNRINGNIRYFKEDERFSLEIYIYRRTIYYDFTEKIFFRIPGR